MPEKILHKYLRQSILIIASLFLIALLYVSLYGSVELMAVPLAICVVFQLVACIVYGKVWRRVASKTPGSLPMLYLAASGIRMMTALAIVVVYLFLEKDPIAVRFFIITFLVFYLVILAYDTAFFMKVEKTTNTND